MELYKYHKLNLHLFQLLSLNSFYCANHNELNDPYDCYFKLSNNLILELFKKKTFDGVDIRTLLNKYLQQTKIELDKIDDGQGKEDDNFYIYETAKKIVTNTNTETKFIGMLLEKINMKIVSFSQKTNENDILMWAHYTDSFKGVRLEFDFSNDKIIKKELQKVNYEGTLPVISDATDLKDALLLKDAIWERENEWRIVTHTISLIQFDINSLKEIVFGYSTPDKMISSIWKLTKALGYNCRYKRFIMSSNGVKLKSIDFSKEPYSAHFKDYII